MTQTVQSDSKSIVVRSTNIVLVDVVRAVAGEWAASRPGLKSRNVELTLRAAEQFRGKLDPPPAGEVQVSITQFDYAGELRMQPLPGVWPGVPLAAGMSLVIYSSSQDARIEKVIDAATLVVEAETVLSGLRIVSKAESQNLHLDAVLALAAPEAPKLDSSFADFMWAEYGDQALASVNQFNLLADFTERKDLTIETRQSFLKGGYDLVGLHGDGTPALAQRLARTMVHLLTIPGTEDLHENLIETFLPNLLGITSELPPQKSADVFRDHETDRAALDAFLRHDKTEAGAVLLKWLHQK